ncbi:MAG: roadblock/LC7 domain-containing protein [Thermoplasmatota archaeon]
MAEMDEIISNLMRKGIRGSAVIDKEGNVYSSDLPRSIHEETFAIMCATIVGASNSANSELDRSRTNKVIIDSKEGHIVIANTKNNLLLTVIVDKKRELGMIFEEIENAVNMINEVN